MIHPAPTTTVPPTLARAVLAESRLGAGTDSPGHIVLEFHNTSYQMHLIPLHPVKGEIGKRIFGTIRVSARRVDTVDTGGKYVEPVIGRPRRVQGRVIAVVPREYAIVVDAGMPITCRLTDGRQSASDFGVGDLVSFDALDGATFEQSEPRL